MRIFLSPIALIRPIGFLCGALTALAVALGHGVSDPDKDRLFNPVRYHAVNGYLFFNGDAAPRLLDAETAQLTRLDLHEAARLEYVSLSPWRDGLGQSRVVGLWEDSVGLRQGQVSRSLGIARYTYPEGRAIDRVPLEVIPTSPPCWYPGMATRVLFAAADGHLYRFAFDEDTGYSGTDDDWRRPRALEWQAELPGLGGLLIGDPVWPNEPGFARTLIVSLSYLEPHAQGEQPVASHAQLWWLRLNTDGTAIEAAGRLTAAAASDEERWPTLTTTPGGGLALAYLTRPPGQSRWQLRLTRVLLDRATTGAPRALPTPAGRLAADCVTTAPIFSYDGRWINVLVRAANKEIRVERLAADSLLADPAD